VGDRYVVEMMKQGGYNLGGEQSGHILFLDHNTTGDGTLAALQVLRVMRERGKAISELAKVMTAYPQVLENVRVRERVRAEDIPGFSHAVRDVEAALGDKGRILIRYSGTEPLMRIMLEGELESEIKRMARSLADIVRSEIGEE